MTKIKKLILDVFVFSVSLVLITSLPVQALNKEYDESFFSANDIVVYDPEYSCSANSLLSSTDTPTGKVDVSDNAEAVLRFFTTKGLSLASASGFVGNMSQESGMNPRARQNNPPASDNFTPIDREGFGLVQWTFTSRQKPLVELAKSTNRKTTDIDLQLDYIWKELNEGYKSTLQALVDAEKDGTISAKKATIIIHGRTTSFQNNPDFADAPKLGYEASADSNYAHFTKRRIDPAIAAYNKFKGTISDGSGVQISGVASASLATSNSSACGGTINGEAFVADGMAFPLVVTEEIIKKGAQGSSWCYRATTNCHHDYNAADIMAPEGTVVVAATDGKAISVKKGVSGARCGPRDTIMINPADGDGVWFYTHLKPNSTVIEEGQQVKAGDKLAVVGPSSAADCTPPHLHIDHLPKPAQRRPGCAGASCSSKGFLDIQPQMKKLYEQMINTRKVDPM